MGGKSILKVLFTLTHLSPLGESVVSAVDFYKVKDKAHFLHGGSPQLVRIQRRVSRKRYLNSKRVYEYERVSLHIPRKYHETIKPFLDKDWQMEIVVQNGSLIIMLLPKNPSEIRSLKAFK
jgi:hypothetical protein